MVARKPRTDEPAARVEVLGSIWPVVLRRQPFVRVALRCGLGHVGRLLGGASWRWAWYFWRHHVIHTRVLGSVLPSSSLCRGPAPSFPGRPS
jgi:hypothetical protein